VLFFNLPRACLTFADRSFADTVPVDKIDEEWSKSTDAFFDKLFKD